MVGLLGTAADRSDTGREARGSGSLGPSGTCRRTQRGIHTRVSWICVE